MEDSSRGATAPSAPTSYPLYVRLRVGGLSRGMWGVKQGLDGSFVSSEASFGDLDGSFVSGF